MFLEHKSPRDGSKQVHKKECLPLSVMFSSRSDPDLNNNKKHDIPSLIETFSTASVKDWAVQTHLTLVKGASGSPVFLRLR